MSKSYCEIKDQHPELFECFFAFSEKQMQEGIAKNNLEGKKLYSGIGGLYGTKEGIAKLYADYDAITEQVKNECNPQDVYDYEFNNHECSYTNDDTEAIKIVDSTFGTERTKEVKRRFAYVSLADLWKNN